MKTSLLAFIARKFIATLLALFSIAGCAASPEAPPQNDKAEGADVRVVQFNLRCTGIGETSIAYRAPLMVAELQAIGADSMGFQEANLRWMTYLTENLTDYAYVGVGREDGKNRGEFSPVFYLKDKYNLIDSGTFWLSDTPEKAGSKYSYSANVRICTYAVLENKETGMRYVHLNTHLDHISGLAREKQFNVILNKVNNIAGDLPVVLTGDFNCRDDSDVYATVTQNFSDSRLLAPVTENKPTFHDYGKQVPRTLDYVFVNERVEPLVYHVIDDKVDNVYLSDHYGIYVDAKIN